MLTLTYMRPTSLDEALSLLNERPTRRLLAGGTTLVPEVRLQHDPVELIDLQAAGLSGIRPEAQDLRLGAMARLGDLQRDGRVPKLLRELCRRELPSALRNQATLGGTVARGDADSVLIAGLLVHDCRVEFNGADLEPLPAVLAAGVGRRIVSALRVNPNGPGVIYSTGRTPADVPIVAAVARRADSEVKLALTGVADHPIEIDPDSPTRGISPVADFRGSAEYRTHLAELLGRRAVAAVKS